MSRPFGWATSMARAPWRRASQTFDPPLSPSKTTCGSSGASAYGAAIIVWSTASASAASATRSSEPA